MKHKIFIAKILIIEIVLNSLSVLSYANTEIPDRYQTLEGENVIIDDSVMDNIEDIQIFGDTWQDDTNSKNLAQIGEFNVSDGEITAIASNNSIRLIGNNYSKHYFEISVFDGFYTNTNKGPWDGPSLNIPANGYHVSSFTVTGAKDDGVGIGVRTHCDNTKANALIDVSNFINSFTIELFNIYGKSFDITISNIQVEKGSTPTQYELYHKADFANIQSVGELYVDKGGNPILDSQGREQYKIDIISNNGVVIFNDVLDINLKLDKDDQHGAYKMAVFQGAPNTTYNFIATLDDNKIIPEGINTAQFGLWVMKNNEWSQISDEGANMYQGVKDYNLTFTTDNTGLFKLRMYDFRPHMKYKTFFVGLSDTPQKYKENKTSIILPTQLQKVGDVADRLYWDNKKGRYIIEKNIGKINISDIGKYNYHTNFTTDGYVRVNISNYNQFDMLENKECVSTYNFVYSWDAWSAYESYSLRDNSLSFRMLQSRLDENTVDGVKKYLQENEFLLYGSLVMPQLIETNITSKLKIPTYNEKTYIYVDSENNINPTLKVTVDRLPQIAKSSIEEAENNSSNYNISLARMYTNMLPESLYKDQLQDQLSNIFSSDIVLDRKTATSNLDLYIKCENILMMSLSTNSITFDDFSGVEDMVKENAVNISINSSLPYQLNAYLPTEIQNADKSNTMDKDILNIKENSESAYQTFSNTTDKIVLKDNCSAGNDLMHGVDIKLKGGIAHEKDVYKTTIKFEAEQK